MNTQDFDRAMKAIKLRESFVLGVVWFGEGHLRGAPNSPSHSEAMNRALTQIKQLLGTKLNESVSYVLACESIDVAAQQSVLSGSRTSRYALLNWRRELAQERTVLLDFRGLDRELMESVGLLTDGMVAIVEEISVEAVDTIASLKKRGVNWLGYWRLQPMAERAASA